MVVAIALTCSFTACSDEVEHNIAAVDAPSFVGVSPQKNIKAGLDSILVTYDKNIFFASEDYTKITLNGEPVVSAHVPGSSNTLLIMANIKRGQTYDLRIPEGLVTGPNRMPVPAVSQTLTAQSQTIATVPVNADATAETKALYTNLTSNYGKKTYSATMAQVAWNTDEAEKVYQLTGKYPAINGYDYIHLNATSEGGWIDYSDISPVKNWHDAGGLVTIGWHWNVPVSNPNASTVPVTLYDGEAVDMDNWSNYLQLTDRTYKDILATASIGSKLTVYISNVESGAQGSIKNSAWAGFVDESGTSWEYFSISGDSYSITLDQTTLNEMKANGLILSGKGYTLTRVTVEAAGTVSYSFYADKNDFSVDNAVTEGTWENDFVKSDLEKITTYLSQLQQAGIPVLWRPLHEAAGKWFWWGAGTAESYKKLWILMYDTFKRKGINNLIWVWTSEGNDDAWYPGDNYVDIIGTDLYGHDGQEVSADEAAARFNALAYRYSQKMIVLSECGTVTDIPAQWKADAQWGWFMPWYSSGDTVHATDVWWKAAMGSEHVITR
ncbi:beta-mannosidase [Prevotella sp. A2931]|uniref:Beta-mannosidase n=1 Tax=Prevotella illustrans TaxID=2800387 RepID=A0ABS3M646_9BACT|nr:beta-mannosidase [Prevotella illustrans]PTL26794.1 beta-mannosidase [Prevotella sp. oral taxon 820]